MHQLTNLDRDLTARENLTLHAILHGIGAAARRERIAEALRFAGLEDAADRPVKTFSGGMGRRLVIVRALLHEPKILLLDEPTVGLDPQIRRDLWELMIRVNQAKRTAILLTTHYIEEAERLCSRVLILDGGRLVAAAAPDALKRGSAASCWRSCARGGSRRAFTTPGRRPSRGSEPAPAPARSARRRSRTSS